MVGSRHSNFYFEIHFLQVLAGIYRSKHLAFPFSHLTAKGGIGYIMVRYSRFLNVRKNGFSMSLDML